MQHPGHQHPYPTRKPAQNLFRSYRGPNDEVGEPKDIWELLRDPHFLATLLSLLFSLSVFLYFFYKLMHGVREDYRRQKARDDERARRRAAGLPEEEEEEGETADEEQEVEDEEAAAGDDDDHAEEKEGRNEQEQVKKSVSASAGDAVLSSAAENRGLRQHDKKESEETATLRKRKA